VVFHKTKKVWPQATGKFGGKRSAGFCSTISASHIFLCIVSSITRQAGECHGV